MRWSMSARRGSAPVRVPVRLVVVEGIDVTRPRGRGVGLRDSGECESFGGLASLVPRDIHEPVEHMFRAQVSKPQVAGSNPAGGADQTRSSMVTT